MRCRWMVCGLATAWLLTACAFEPGAPWGRLEITPQLQWPDRPGRVTPEGHWETLAGYELRLDRVAVGIESASVVARAGAGAGESVVFDPASPPPGYSLCHNGHCHRDDGALVDYEDIQAELDAAAGNTGRTWVQEYNETPVDLLHGGAPQALTCMESCELPRGELIVTRAQLNLSSLHVEARVFDVRLPNGEADITLAVPIAASVSAPVDYAGDVDRFRKIGVRVELAYVAPYRLFDALDFAELIEGAADPGPVDIGTPAVAAQLAEVLSTDGELSAHVTRFDPQPHQGEY